MGAPSRARIALVLQSVVPYARYGSELARVAVGSCDDVTCTVRRNANFAHSAFQEVPRACLQLLCHGRCFWASRRVLVGVKRFNLQRMQLLIVPE